MQDWITIRAANSILTVTQSADSWLDLSPFQDVVAWLHVSEITLGGGTSIQLAYQTAPTEDESLFTPITPAFNLATGVTTTVMLKDAAAPAIPLARWLRWQLTATGTLSSAWDLTFRVYVAANSPGKRSPSTPTKLPWKVRSAKRIYGSSTSVGCDEGALERLIALLGAGDPPLARFLSFGFDDVTQEVQCIPLRNRSKGKEIR